MSKNQYTLGSNNDFKLPDSSDKKQNEKIVTQKPIIENNNTKGNSRKYSFEDIYELFVANNLLILQQNKKEVFWQYLKTKPEFFLIYDLIPFKELPNDILKTIENYNSSYNIAIRNNCYDYEKAALINRCLQYINELFQLFMKSYNNEKRNYYKQFVNESKQYIYEKLFESLKKIENDNKFSGLIEIKDIKSLLNYTKELYLWDGNSQNDREEIIKKLEEEISKDGFKIASYKQSFCKEVVKLPYTSRLRNEIEESLLMKYHDYKTQELEFYNKSLPNTNRDEYRDELRTEMIQILEEEKLLVDKKSTYENDYFNTQINLYFDYPLLLSEQYMTLKFVACNIYKFKEEEWIKFAQEKKLRKLDDLPVTFILGEKKASTLSKIANLLEDNKTKAIERIIDGDLETFLNHIRENKLAKEIKEITNKFKDNKEELFKHVLIILRGINPVENENDNETSINDRKSLLDLIQRDCKIEEMIEYLLNRKTREKLNERLLTESKDRAFLNEYLVKKNISFICLCMNYLLKFPEEHNAERYTHIYEMYARYVLEVIKEKNEFIFFLSGYIKILKITYLSKSFINELNEIEDKMQNEYKSFLSKNL